MKIDNPNIKAIKLCHSFSRSYFPLMALNSFFSNLSPYFNLYLSAEIINEIAGNRRIGVLTVLVLITVGGNLLISLMGGFISNRLSISEIVLTHSETQYYMDKLLHMDYSDFENPDVRQLRRKITESSKISSHGRTLLLKSVNRIVNAAIGTVIALCLAAELFLKSYRNSSFQIALVFGAVIILLMLANILYNYKIQGKNADAANSTSKAMVDNNRIDNAIECYNMGKDVRLYRLDSIIMKIKRNRLISHRKAFEKYSMYQFRTGIPMLILTTLLNFSVYIYVVYNSIIGSFGFGSIVKYVGLSQKLIQSILDIFRGFTDIKRNTKFIDDYLAFFDIPQAMQEGTKPVDNNSDCKYIIEFRNVSFKYPSSDTYALKNISIRISSGERIGIVGQNGSGKTTFIKLMCRLYDPTEGRILFNGIDIKQYDYHEYLSKLSVVFQDFKIFSFSIGQNISGSDRYNPSVVESCLRKVGFGERLAKMENGVETCLYKDFDNGGVEISGGEAQKIALARALYKNSSIIVLDEPTAALDPISESEIYSKFNEIAGEKTAIYISHRLSSCKYCDKIAVFDNGRIVQCGNHQELVTDTGGKYFELWSIQAQYYTE